MRPRDVLLDEADVLDHLTGFDGLPVPVMKKPTISSVVGNVSIEP
jgi:hypothetical protein